MSIVCVTAGLGSDTGWGICGDLVEKCLEELGPLLDNNLRELASARQKILSAALALEREKEEAAKKLRAEEDRIKAIAEEDQRIREMDNAIAGRKGRGRRPEAKDTRTRINRGQSSKVIPPSAADEKRSKSPKRRGSVSI